MSQGADPDEIGLMNIDEQLPVLEYPQPGLDIIQVRARGEAGAGGVLGQHTDTHGATGTINRYDHI